MALVEARWLRRNDRFAALGSVWKVLKREPVDSMEMSMGRVEFKVACLEDDTTAWHPGESMLNLPGTSQYRVLEGPTQ